MSSKQRSDSFWNLTRFFFRQLYTFNNYNTKQTRCLIMMDHFSGIYIWQIFSYFLLINNAHKFSQCQRLMGTTLMLISGMFCFWKSLLYKKFFIRLKSAFDKIFVCLLSERDQILIACSVGWAHFKKYMDYYYSYAFTLPAYVLPTIGHAESVDYHYFKVTIHYRWMSFSLRLIYVSVS